MQSNQFGDLLRQARHDRKLGQSALAGKLGFSARYISRLEAGGSLPSLPTFVALWQVLGFDPNALIHVLINASRKIPQRLMVKQPVETTHAVHGKHIIFGVFLTQARLALQLTQEAVAFAAHIGANFVRRIEVGYQLPALRTFARLCHYLQFDVNEAFEAITSEPSSEPYAAFGQIITAARRKSEIEPVALAGVLGCHPLTYARIESGAELPTLRMLARLHHKLALNGNKVLRAVWFADAREAV